MFVGNGMVQYWWFVFGFIRYVGRFRYFRECSCWPYIEEERNMRTEKSEIEVTKRGGKDRSGR